MNQIKIHAYKNVKLKIQKESCEDKYKILLFYDKIFDKKIFMSLKLEKKSNI